MIPLITNHIGGVMVSMLTSSAGDHGFEPQSGQTKDYKIGICCSSAKHTSLRSKSKDWLAWNQNNVSRVERHVYPWTVVSVSKKSNSAGWSRTKRTSSSSHWKLTCSRHDIAEKLLSSLNNNHSLTVTPLITCNRKHQRIISLFTVMFI